MSQMQVDPEAVIAKLARQIGQLSAELAMAQAVIDSLTEEAKPEEG